ncbi:MAG: MarR family winged helix-turn-helix transcriptional regulator [Pseudomonadota bacterium]|jgi:DNA-binding MarR family transcriptional regulator
MDFVRGQAARAFGTRLRRLSERLDREVQEIYRAADERFEPRWFAVVTALREGPATVGDLAARIGVTHAAISQVRSALIAEGLVRSVEDAADLRRRRLELTARGEATVARLEPLWSALAEVTSELLATAAPALLQELDSIEAALGAEPLPSRVRARLAAAALGTETP